MGDSFLKPYTFKGISIYIAYVLNDFNEIIKEEIGNITRLLLFFTNEGTEQFFFFSYLKCCKKKNILNYSFCDTKETRHIKLGMVVIFKIQMLSKYL